MILRLYLLRSFSRGVVSCLAIIWPTIEVSLFTHWRGCAGLKVEGPLQITIWLQHGDCYRAWWLFSSCGLHITRKCRRCKAFDFAGGVETNQSPESSPGPVINKTWPKVVQERPNYWLNQISHRPMRLSTTISTLSFLMSYSLVRVSLCAKALCRESLWNIKSRKFIRGSRIALQCSFNQLSPTISMSRRSWTGPAALETHRPLKWLTGHNIMVDTLAYI